ncbi:adenylyltransferase/cytidyltransferase family protein [Chloroflexota bacterium]
MRIVVVSGGFDPIHKGHIRMMIEAEKLGDKLIVILNSDKFLDEKKKNSGGRFYPDIDEREEIVAWGLGKRYGNGNEAMRSIDTDMSVGKTLELIREKYPDDEIIFANGGDRKDAMGILEYQTCVKQNIQMVFNVGGGKIQSSSWLSNGTKKK